jgi:hypothetical protein
VQQNYLEFKKLVYEFSHTQVAFSEKLVVVPSMASLLLSLNFLQCAERCNIPE